MQPLAAITVDFGRRPRLCLAAIPNWNGMFKRLYDWLIALSQSASAPYALAAVAFAESSFFPIPPDVILAPMSLAKPQLAWRYALIAMLASVVGGMLGYAIGALLYDTLGQWLIGVYGYGDRIAAWSGLRHLGRAGDPDQAPKAHPVQAGDNRQRPAGL